MPRRCCCLSELHNLWQKFYVVFSLSLIAKRTEEVRKIEKSGTAVAAVRVRQVKEGTLKKREKNMKIACVLTACVHDWTQRWQQS